MEVTPGKGISHVGEKMNAPSPKYVCVPRTLTAEGRRLDHSTVIRPGPPRARIADGSSRTWAGDILVAGRARLVEAWPTLIELDGWYRLMVSVVLGSGKRPSANDMPPKTRWLLVRLVGHQAAGPDGVWVLLT